MGCVELNSSELHYGLSKKRAAGREARLSPWLLRELLIYAKVGLLPSPQC